MALLGMPLCAVIYNLQKLIMLLINSLQTHYCSRSYLFSYESTTSGFYAILHDSSFVSCFCCWVFMQLSFLEILYGGVMIIQDLGGLGVHQLLSWGQKEVKEHSLLTACLGVINAIPGAGYGA